MEIARWLEGLGLAKYAAAFAEAEIEFDVLPDLTDAELEKLGIYRRSAAPIGCD